MARTRRDFIRYVVAGSVAAGCPVDLELMAEPAPDSPEVHGEENEICHQVRDGRRFRRPPISARYEIVIVGGGISGLSAAYFLKDRDYLLLEKDAHFGGNAYVEEFGGQAYATGSAFVTEDETTLIGLAKEIGLAMLPVNQLDSTIVKGEQVTDVWTQKDAKRNSTLSASRSTCAAMLRRSSSGGTASDRRTGAPVPSRPRR
jgi:hypothetical protein